MSVSPSACGKNCKRAAARVIPEHIDGVRGPFAPPRSPAAPHPPRRRARRLRGPAHRADSTDATASPSGSSRSARGCAGARGRRGVPARATKRRSGLIFSLDPRTTWLAGRGPLSSRIRSSGPQELSFSRTHLGTNLRPTHPSMGWIHRHRG